MPLFDFKKLLSGLAKGLHLQPSEAPDVMTPADALKVSLSRQPNAPPPMQLTPAQTALHEMGQGAGLIPSSQVNNSAVTTTDTPSVNQAIANQPIIPQPVQFNPQQTLSQPVDTSQMTDTSNQRVSGMVPQTAQQMTSPDIVNAPRNEFPDQRGHMLDESTADAQQAYIDALNAPIQKQAWWKDLGAKLLTGVADAGMGQRGDFKNIMPIEGYGKLKHNDAIRTAAERLNPLLQQQAIQRQAAQQQANIDLTNVRAPVLQQQANTNAARVAQIARYQNDTIDFKLKSDKWKQEDRDEWLKLQKEKIDGVQTNNQAKIDEADRRQTEIERHNQATEEITTKKNENTNTNQVLNRNQRSQLQADRQKYGAAKARELAKTNLRQELVKQGQKPTDAELEDYLQKQYDPMFSTSGFVKSH